MKLTEPTFQNLAVGIFKTMAPGVGFPILIGATRQGTRLLQDDPEEQLPLAEMIRIRNSRLVCIWWSLIPTSERMEPLLCCHRRNDTADSTPPPGEIRFAPRVNWAPLQTLWMMGPLVEMMDRALMATSLSHPLRPQSEPPPQGPPGAVIPQKRLGEHRVAIGRTLANQSHISKTRVCSRRIGIASARRKSVWSILSAQSALRWP